MRDDTRLQLADVIVAHHDNEASGVVWARRILAEYPGCLVAVSVGADWVLIRTRCESCPES